MELHNLINDIINDLIDTDASVTGPLLKTKIFAYRSKNDKLLEWVNNELTGYLQINDLDFLPKHRKQRANLIGTFDDGASRYTNSPLPLDGMDKETIESLSSIHFYQSISTLEAFKTDKETAILEFHLPSQTLAAFSKYRKSKGHQNFRLYWAKKKVSAASVEEVLITVRNQLLDFMLKIDEEFGFVTTIEDLKSKKNEIIQIMNQTINTTGDGNVINTGDNANLTINIKISKGNKEELSKVLEENGVLNEDIESLKKIIDSNESDKSSNNFGQPINSWTQMMLGKALDGTWKISISVAGNLLATVIKGYLGW